MDNTSVHGDKVECYEQIQFLEAELSYNIDIMDKLAHYYINFLHKENQYYENIKELQQSLLPKSITSMSEGASVHVLHHFLRKVSDGWKSQILSDLMYAIGVVSQFISLLNSKSINVVRTAYRTSRDSWHTYLEKLYIQPHAVVDNDFIVLKTEFENNTKLYLNELHNCFNRLNIDFVEMIKVVTSFLTLKVKVDQESLADDQNLTLLQTHSRIYYTSQASDNKLINLSDNPPLTSTSSTTIEGYLFICNNQSKEEKPTLTYAQYNTISQEITLTPCLQSLEVHRYHVIYGQKFASDTSKLGKHHFNIFCDNNLKLSATCILPSESLMWLNALITTSTQHTLDNDKLVSPGSKIELKQKDYKSLRTLKSVRLLVELMESAVANDTFAFYEMEPELHKAYTILDDMLKGVNFFEQDYDLSDACQALKILLKSGNPLIPLQVTQNFQNMMNDITFREQTALKILELLSDEDAELLNCISNHINRMLSSCNRSKEVRGSIIDTFIPLLFEHESECQSDTVIPNYIKAKLIEEVLISGLLTSGLKSKNVTLKRRRCLKQKDPENVSESVVAAQKLKTDRANPKSDCNENKLELPFTGSRVSSIIGSYDRDKSIKSLRPESINNSSLIKNVKNTGDNKMVNENVKLKPVIKFEPKTQPQSSDTVVQIKEPVIIHQTDVKKEIPLQTDLMPDSSKINDKISIFGPSITRKVSWQQSPQGVTSQNGSTNVSLTMDSLSLSSSAHDKPSPSPSSVDAHQHTSLLTQQGNDTVKTDTIEKAQTTFEDLGSNLITPSTSGDNKEENMLQSNKSVKESLSRRPHSLKSIGSKHSIQKSDTHEENDESIKQVVSTSVSLSSINAADVSKSICEESLSHKEYLITKSIENYVGVDKKESDNDTIIHGNDKLTSNDTEGVSVSIEQDDVFSAPTPTPSIVKIVRRVRAPGKHTKSPKLALSYTTTDMSQSNLSLFNDSTNSDDIISSSPTSSVPLTQTDQRTSFVTPQQMDSKSEEKKQDKKFTFTKGFSKMVRPLPPTINAKKSSVDKLPSHKTVEISQVELLPQSTTKSEPRLSSSTFGASPNLILQEFKLKCKNKKSEE